MFRSLVPSVVLMLLSCSMSLAEDWPRFRGPNGDGVSTSKIPVSWTPTANIAWKSQLPGAGVSSPIVVGDLLFVTCYSGYGLDRNALRLTTCRQTSPKSAIPVASKKAVTSNTEPISEKSAYASDRARLPPFRLRRRRVASERKSERAIECK
jgi:hypothetical protein